MENLCRRFPLVSKMVFNELDDQSLTQVKMSNREICQYLEEERFYWVRVLKSFKGRVYSREKGEWQAAFNESWKNVVNKAPVEIIQQFVIACHNFFEHYPACDWSPLHIAAGSGPLSLFQMTYEKTGKSNPWTWIIGFELPFELTPLHIAAGAGQLEICRLIMDDLDDKNPGNPNVYPNGYTPLHHAARWGSVEACKLIMDKLDNKTPLSSRGGPQVSPLYYAVCNGHLEVCRFILENGGTGNLDYLLRDAAHIGYLDICILIMERLEDKNPRDTSGVTPFHLAANAGELEICKLFVKLLAEKNPSDNHGDTPLHLAAGSGCLDICQLISSEIQDKKPVNDHGKTPLAYAIEENHQDVVDFLSS